jgi:hypothetical protein
MPGAHHHRLCPVQLQPASLVQTQIDNLLHQLGRRKRLKKLHYNKIEIGEVTECGHH